MERQNKFSGITLLEMLLVMAIMSSVIVMIIGFMQQRTREIMRDRVALQMQQILNAGLSYYVNNSPSTTPWPTSVAALQPNYLPSGWANRNPWGQPYTVTSTATGNLFTVTTDVRTNREATILAGRLPLASASGTVVTASVGIPGQNLNNARAVNFAGIYHSGACVPAPVCPAGMSANIMVVPVQAYGVYDQITCSNIDDINTCGSPNVYPLAGYSAYAVGGSGSSIINCDGTGPSQCYQTQAWTGGTNPLVGNYYRVCLSILTEKGKVVPSGTYQYNQGRIAGSVMALTRCVPTGEPSGSDFRVWSN